MGVMMGDEMLIAFMLLDLRGDLSADKRDDVRDWVFSVPRSRSRLAGLFRGFFRMLLGCEATESCFVDGAAAGAGDSGDGGRSRMMPACFAASCSNTYLYISSS